MMIAVQHEHLKTLQFNAMVMTALQICSFAVLQFCSFVLPLVIRKVKRTIFQAVLVKVVNKQETLRMIYIKCIAHTPNKS